MAQILDPHFENPCNIKVDTEIHENNLYYFSILGKWRKQKYHINCTWIFKIIDFEFLSGCSEQNAPIT